MRARRSSGPPEAPRDQHESEFTVILRHIWDADDEVLAAVFVDREGECVDYCSSLEPFDAKVNGAQLNVVTADLVERVRGLGFGEASDVVVHCDFRTLLIRRVSDNYTLVVVMEPNDVSRAIWEAVDRAAQVLRRESVLSIPPWEPDLDRVHVLTKPSSVGLGYSPESFFIRGERVGVTDVLGSWVEGENPRFRVRTDDSRELTLALDALRATWTILEDSEK